MATQKAKPPVEVAGVNFGDLSMYSGGGGIPPGPFALEFTVRMFAATDKQGVSKFAERLGVMVKAHSLTDPDKRGDNAYSQFYSMGSDAHKSFQPNAETGKSLVAVPGGPATTLARLTNWDVLLKSFYDSGLPQGVFTNDISVLDGMHVTMAQIDEPEERKTFTTPGSEAGAERKGSGKISVVSEIHDDGKPWEGKGGIPDGKAPATKTAPAKTTGPQVVNKPAETGVDEADILSAAISGASAVLEKNVKGVARLVLRTGTFKAVQDTIGEEMAQAVATTFFGSDDALNRLLSQLGYVVSGAMVKPA